MPFPAASVAAPAISSQNAEGSPTLVTARIIRAMRMCPGSDPGNYRDRPPCANPGVRGHGDHRFHGFTNGLGRRLPTKRRLLRRLRVFGSVEGPNLRECLGRTRSPTDFTDYTEK